MKLDVSPDDVDEFKADSRGRITLGSEYAGKTIEVAVLDDE